MRARLVCIASVVAVAATACATVQIQQSSLVPAPVAPAPATDRGIADVYLGDATVTFISRPKRAPDDDSGLWIARHLLQGAITVHANRLLAVRLAAFDGLHQGALQAAPTSLRVPSQDVRGYSWGGIVSVPIDRHELVASLEAEWAAESEPWEAAANIILDDVILPENTRQVIADGLAYAWPTGQRVTPTGAST